MIYTYVYIYIYTRGKLSARSFLVVYRDVLSGLYYTGPRAQKATHGMNTGGYIVSKCFKKTKFIRSREKKENFETIQSIKIFQNCQLVAASIERIFLPSDIRIHLRGTISPGYRIGTSHRDKRIWTARATRKHGGRRKKKIGRGGGEVELRGQTKNRVTTIIAVPGRKVSSLSLCVFGAMADRQECRLGRDVETRRGGGQGKVFVAEGVLKVFAEQIHEEAGN